MTAKSRKRRVSRLGLVALNSALMACSGAIDEPTPHVSAGGSSATAGAGGSGSPAATGGSGANASEQDAGEGGGQSGAGSSSGGSSSGAGSGGSSPGSGGSAAISHEPVCDAVTVVFQQSCGVGACHGNPGATIGDFGVGQAEAAALVDVPSRRNLGCGFYIDSSDTSQSLILRKLIGDFGDQECGGTMPAIGRDLTPQEIDCVESWLTQFQR